MGFPLLKVVNILTTLVETGKGIYDKFFTPNDGDHTDLTVNTGITYAFSNLLPQIDKFRALGQLDTEEQIDNFFAKADEQDNMIRLFKGMPEGVEEEFKDGMLLSAKIYAKHKAKIAGYYVE